MRSYILKIKQNESAPFKDLEASIVADFVHGVNLAELEEYSLRIVRVSTDLFQQLLFLIKESHIYLECTDAEGQQVELRTPILAYFLTANFIEESQHLKKDLSLHPDAIAYKENSSTKILNPKTKSSMLFQGSLQAILNSLSTDPLLYELIQKAELLTKENLPQINSGPFMDAFVYQRMHDGSERDYNPAQLLDMMAKQADPFPRKVLEFEELNKYDLTKSLLGRASVRRPSAALTQETLKKLISLVFAKTGNGNMLYPAAGAIYDIFPIIQIYDESIGLAQGTYTYSGQNEELIFSGQNGIFPSPEQQGPRCCISLIADPKLSRYKYGTLSLKLSLLNAGVLLSYFYLFSNALGLNGCAYGQKSTKDSFLRDEHKDLAGFCLY